MCMIEHIASMKVQEGHYRTFCQGHPKMLEDMLKATDTRRNTINRNHEYALMELLMQERVIMEVMDENDNLKKSPCKYSINCRSFDATGVTCNDSKETAFCGTFRGFEKITK